jgi:hypothetical protein
VRPWREQKTTTKRLIRAAPFRKELYPHFIASGGRPEAWPRVLKIEPVPEQLDDMPGWGAQEWKHLLEIIARDYPASSSTATQLPLTLVGDGKSTTIDEALLDAVRQILPAQPWADGVHREVAEKLDISNRAASRCIAILIERGVFIRQVDGQLFLGEEEPGSSVSDPS